ncbi:hypothetical protein V8F33_003667 [Rhypophila sp. PSN 637]
MIPRLPALRQVTIDIWDPARYSCAMEHGTSYNKKYAPITFFTSPTKRNIPWHLDRSNINYYNGGPVADYGLRVDIPEYRPPHTRARSWLCSRGRLLGPRIDIWPIDAVLGALQKSDNRPGITSLKVDGLDCRYLATFAPLAVVSQLANLRDVDLEFANETPHNRFSRWFRTRTLNQGPLRDFLSALPNLEHLTISFTPMEPRWLLEE